MRKWLLERGLALNRIDLLPADYVEIRQVAGMRELEAFEAWLLAGGDIKEASRKAAMKAPTMRKNLQRIREKLKARNS